MGAAVGGNPLPWSFHFRPLSENRELKGKVVCHKTQKYTSAISDGKVYSPLSGDRVVEGLQRKDQLTPLAMQGGKRLVLF